MQSLDHRLLNSAAAIESGTERWRADFNTNGFITSLPVFDAVEVDANRALFDSLQAQFGDDGYAINCYQARLQGIWDLCTDARILDCVEAIIGPDIVCWASHFFCKLPLDPKAVPWHQDAVFWHLDQQQTLTVWLAIDDADAENSAMQFIPGSHRYGTLDWESASGAVLDKQISAQQLTGKKVHNCLKAGSISLHSDMLAHGSEPNRSDRRRCGLTIRYCTSSTRVTNAAWREGIEAILCRGKDKDSYWPHHVRPDSNRVTDFRQPRSVGAN